MLDKAPNGKVSDLLNALDKALSAGEVDRAVDLFQADLRGLVDRIETIFIWCLSMFI